MEEKLTPQSPAPGEELYRYLFLHSPIPMWIADRQTLQILEFNNAARDRYELTDEDRGVITIQTFRKGSSLEEIKADYEKMASTPGAKLERRHHLRSGRVIDIIVTAHALDYLGRPCNLVQIVDITEVKRAQQELQVSENRLRQLFEQSPISIQRYATDGSALDANPAWEALFQSKREQLQGYNILQDQQLAAKGIRPYIERAFAGEFQTIPPQLYDPAEIGQEGRARWVEAYMYPVKDPAGTIHEVVLLLRDVTDAIEAQSALQEREQTFARFLDSALDAVVTIDDEGRILEWRGASEAVFGYSREEACGQYLGDLLVPERYREAHSAGLSRYRSSRQGRVLNHRLELSALRKDGTEFPIQLEIAAIPRGEHVIFGAFIRDLTQQKADEAEIRALNTELESRVEERTRQLTEAVRELEGFTYSVSHDLRGPLRAIVATSKLVLEDYGPQLPEEVQEELRNQAAAAKKLAVLIDDLLNYSRIGRRQPVLQAVDLSGMAARIVAQLKAHHSSRSLDFRIQPGLRATGDAQMIELALQNLLENAVKFTAASGEGKIEFGRDAGHPEAPFFVRDNGIGFDMKYVHKLFIPFERLHLEREYPGTGIGLANVSRIVERHGGRVWAEATLGEGATFFFTLGARD